MEVIMSVQSIIRKGIPVACFSSAALIFVTLSANAQTQPTFTAPKAPSGEVGPLRETVRPLQESTTPSPDTRPRIVPDDLLPPRPAPSSTDTAPSQDPAYDRPLQTAPSAAPDANRAAAPNRGEGLTQAQPVPAAPSGATPASDAPVPAPLRNFQGISYTGFSPPDTGGAVGPNHYVQMVNSSFAIYDKQGNVLRSPVDIGSLWANSAGQDECKANYGDPIVVYDALADRWLLSQFAIQGGAVGYHLCVAISKGPNPVTDGFYLYAFQTPVFPDFPKFGVWPNAYFVSTYEEAELGLYALDRTAMLTGAAAATVRSTLPALSAGRTRTRILPADLEGRDGPPAGSGNWFVRSVNGALQGGGADRLEVYEFKVNFAAHTSSVGLVGTLTTTAYDIEMCGAALPRDCIPQPGTAQKLDPLSNRLMMRLQYRNFGTYETLVTNQTVDVGSDRAGIRWYELRRSGGAWSINRQGTFTVADNIHRWMGSAASDRLGNIAIGYSVSAAANVFPGLRYNFVAPTVFQEGTIVAGSGSQTGGPRWGDYSAMTLDPDGCTFWFTSMYFPVTGAGGWQTRIASFRHPNCSPLMAQVVEYGKDRPGSDIGNFNLPAGASPALCQGACAANASCEAWTFVRTGWQGPTPRCWLKKPAPAPIDAFCCVSGQK